MRNIVLVLLFGIFAVVAGCKKGPTGPEEPHYTLETSETIGSDGGTIETNDFLLTVPSGAFDSTVTLELYASSDDRPFGDNSVSRTFRLEGLPPDYYQPLRVSIKYEGTITEESFIAHGEWAFDPIFGDSDIVYSLHAATDSSGYLVCEIPSLEGDITRRAQGALRAPQNTTKLEGVLTLQGITGILTHDTEPPYFKIRYPAYLVEVNITDVGKMLVEDHDSIVSGTGLSFPDRRPWLWPMSVLVPKRTFMACAAYIICFDRYRSDHDPPWGSFCKGYVNQTMLSQGDFTPVRIEFGQDLLDELIYDYMVAGRITVDNVWFKKAVTTWAEELFTDNPTFQCPDSFPGHEMAPFNGMQAGIQAGEGDPFTKAENHGRGMSAVIKYLVDHLGYADDLGAGKTGLALTCEALSDADDATTVLLNNVNALVAEWWPEFFRSYVGGEIYGVSSDVFTKSENLSGSCKIKNDTDTLEVFTASYYDLSAKLYMINLNHPSIDESANMMLELSGHAGTTEPLTVMVFGFKDGSLDYWDHSSGEGSTSLEIQGLRDLIDDGWDQLLVVAVNSNPLTPTGRSDIDLKIEIAKEPPGPQYNSFDFLIRITGHFRHAYGDTSSELYYDFSVEPFGVDVIPGEMTEENKFEGSFQSEGDSGKVIATFNATHDTILAVNLEMTSVAQDGREWYHSFAATGVPISWEDEDWAFYRVDGVEVCNYLDDVQDTYQNPAAAGNDLQSKTLLGFQCTDTGAYPSVLVLKFHKE